MNTYARLWHEYEELTSSIGALDVTLGILERYLLQLYEYNGVNLKPRSLITTARTSSK